MIDIGLPDDTTSMWLSTKGNVPILGRIFKYIYWATCDRFFLFLPHPHFHRLLLTSMENNQNEKRRERENNTMINRIIDCSFYSVRLFPSLSLSRSLSSYWFLHPSLHSRCVSVLSKNTNNECMVNKWIVDNARGKMAWLWLIDKSYRANDTAPAERERNKRNRQGQNRPRQAYWIEYILYTYLDRLIFIYIRMYE